MTIKSLAEAAGMGEVSSFSCSKELHSMAESLVESEDIRSCERYEWLQSMLDYII